MIRASSAAFFMLCGLMLMLQTAQAGPRLTIGFVSLPPGTTSASCANAAKSALDPFFSNARIQSGNGHAFSGVHTVILYCDVEVHQAYIILSGNESDSTVRSVEDLKAQIKAKLLQMIPGARSL
jgi:hypothetical protein